MICIAGSEISLGNLVFTPPRNGPTLWEIGIPDRTAAEFYIPDPAPGLRNPSFNNHTEKYVYKSTIALVFRLKII